MIGSTLPMSNPEQCAWCSKGIDDPTNAIQTTRPHNVGGGRSVPVIDLICVPCWSNPNGPRPEPPKLPRTLPYKTLADANARAEKIATALGVALPDIRGNAETGYAVIGDSTLVPGHKPNPWA